MVCVYVFVLEFLFLAITQPPFFASRSEALQIILIGFFALSYVLSVLSSRKVRFLAAPLIVGLMLRLVLLFWDVFFSDVFMLPNSGADSVEYFRRASNFAAGVTNTEENFYLVAGLILKIIGNAKIYLQFINVVYSLVAIYLFVSLLAYFRVQNSISRFCTWILCILPNFGILSVIFLRESLIILLCSASLYFFLIGLHEWKIGKIVFAFALVFFASYLHGGSIAVAAGYAVVVTLYDRKSQQVRFTAKTIILGVGFLFLFAFLYTRYGDVLFAKIAGIESISDVAGISYSGGSSYAMYVGNSDSILNMIIYTPARIIFFLFSPMPWLWRGISDIIAFFGSSIFYLVCVYQIFKTLIKYPESRTGTIMVLAIILFCTIFVFGWGVSNSGTAARHRDKIVVFAAFALAECLNYRRGWRFHIGRVQINL